MTTKKKMSIKTQLQNTYLQKFSSISNIILGINRKSRSNEFATFNDLYSLLCNPIMHIQALGNIKSNKGMATAGIDKKTLDGMNFKLIESIANEIKDKTFKFSPVRRVYIPKPGKAKKRPLGIPILKDRIVQETIRLILEAIYEPVFELYKHPNFGFRPNKSAHDAIIHLQRNGTACNAAIEGDIVGAYDNVNINILINILRKKIKDENFLNLIKQGCHSGMIDFGEYKETILGVPQGGITSPILFNIYMNEFDQYINTKLNKVLEKYNILNHRKKQVRNPIYRSIESKLSSYKKKIDQIYSLNDYHKLDDFQRLELDSLLINKKQLLKTRINTPAILKHKRAIRIVYCRYADDWIILTNGTLEFTSMLKNHIAKWFRNNLKLELSPEKTKVTNIELEYAHFLGFILFTYQGTNITKNPSGDLIRTAGYNIKIGIDKERVLNRLFLKNFCDKNFKPIGNAPYSVLSISEIINKYNAIIRGMANYYILLIDNLSSFSQIYYILSYSAYGTISTKYKSSIFKIMSKYGKPPIFKVEMNIKKKHEQESAFTQDFIPIKSFSLITYEQAKESALKIKYNFEGELEDPFTPMQKINWRTYKNLQAFCVICGSRTDVEWHHLRSIKSTNTKLTGFSKVMQSLNRKQLPLCKLHHIEVTNGKYDGIKISDLAEINYWLT